MAMRLRTTGCCNDVAVAAVIVIFSGGGVGGGGGVVGRQWNSEGCSRSVAR